MKPTNRVGRTWAVLSGTRLSIACMGLLIALTAAGEAASAWLAQDGSRAHPEVVTGLRLSGLNDIPNSPGFISVLTLFALNLFCGILIGLPEAWTAARSALPAQASSEEGEQVNKTLLRSEFETRLGKEVFAELARRWAQKGLGRSPVLHFSTKDLLFTVKRGRYHLLLRLVAHLALGFCLAGAALMHMRGFQARIVIEEGRRGRAFELLRGTPPDHWKAYEIQGRAVPGYYDPGIEIEYPATPELRDRKGSFLQFYEEGKLVGSVNVEQSRPVGFRDLTLHLLDYVPGSAQSVSLTATERGSGAIRRFPALSKGKITDLEDFRFRILEIQLPTDINGPAVQLEYQERGKPVETLWLFKEFPDYDFAHRKASAQHFTLERVQQHAAAELLLGREPGALWLWGGLSLLALLFWLALMGPEERYWIRWTPGSEADTHHRVEFVGWSPRPLLFEPRFYFLAGGLERQIESAEAGDGSV